nr:cytochrome c [Pseudodesulfovibrio sp.]
MNKLCRLCVMVILILLGVSVHVAAHQGLNHEEPTKHASAMMRTQKAIPNEYKVMDRTPVTPDVASIEKGKALFNENCSMCHGEKGDGKGELISDMELSIASFRDKKHSEMYGPGEKYWIIQNGVDALEMPAFPEFSPEERWALVNYIIYSLQNEKP